MARLALLVLSLVIMPTDCLQKSIGSTAVYEVGSPRDSSKIAKRTKALIQELKKKVRRVFAHTRQEHDIILDEAEFAIYDELDALTNTWSSPERMEVSALTYNIQPEDERKHYRLMHGWYDNYRHAVNFLVDQGAGKLPTDFFAFQEFGHHREGKERHNGKTVLGEFVKKAAERGTRYNYTEVPFQSRRRSYICKECASAHHYGIQLAYNMDRFDLKGNLSFAPVKPGDPRARPCVVGLFQEKTIGMYGMVGSCHLPHTGSRRRLQEALTQSLREKYDDAKKSLVQEESRRRRKGGIKIGFEILMGDFNEVGRDLKTGKDNFLRGWTAPHDGPFYNQQKTIGSYIADRILYTHDNVDEDNSPTIETFVVENRHKQTKWGNGGSTSNVDDFEVSDHRPRKIKIAFRI